MNHASQSRREGVSFHWLADELKHQQRLPETEFRILYAKDL